MRSAILLGAMFIAKAIGPHELPVFLQLLGFFALIAFIIADGIDFFDKLK